MAKHVRSHPCMMTVLVWALLTIGVGAPWVQGQQLTLADHRRPSVSVVVSPQVRQAQARVVGRDVDDAALLRAAAEDLAVYLHRLSGATVEIVEQPVAGTVPIYLGMAPVDQPRAHLPSGTTRFGDGYVVDVGADRIVLGGESARATFYAAATLLHELGVRWYAPGELGEVVPSLQRLALDRGRREFTPDFQTRHIWRRGEDETLWVLRNRAGGPAQAQGHAFGAFMGYGRHFAEHPEWYPVVNGQPIRHNANVSHPDVLERFVNKVREQFEAGAPWVCVGPDDGFLLDERPESRAMASGRIDPLLGMPCSTDLLVNFVNQIARQLEDDFGDRQLTFYVYSNHQLPPTVEPHPMVTGIITPIGYSRYASSGLPGNPFSMLLKEHTQAWAKATHHPLGFYLYDFNLADVAMPYSRRTYFAREIPNMHAWGARDATIQTFRNWHAMIPGMFLAARLLWDVDADVDALLDAFYPAYYGPAAAAMRRYDDRLADAYESSSAFAGNLWSMHRTLLPILGDLRDALTEAQAAVTDAVPYAQRVDIVRLSLAFAEHHFAARDALNRFDLAEAQAHSDAFLANFDVAREKHPLYFDPIIPRYWQIFHHRSYTDAGRIAREGTVIHRLPDALSAFLDDHRIGEQMGLGDPGADASNWITLRTHHVSLDEQGFPLFRGVVWYRHTFETPPAARGARQVIFWIGGMDGPTRVYLNDHDLGLKRVSNFNPMAWDITEALNPDVPNTLVIASDNTFVNELGTGGVMRPMLIYIPRDAAQPGDADERERTTDEAIFGGDA